MPYSPNQHEEKPYNACIDCKHLGKNCDGPNFLAMTPERFGEWVKLRKQYKGWTLEYLAEKSGVSESSLRRIIAGKAGNLMWDTVQPIAQVLVDGSWGQYPCAWAASTGALDNDTEHLKAALASEKEKVAYLKQQIAMKDKQIEERGQMLRERREYLKFKDRWIVTFAVAFAIALLYIIITLIVDFNNPHLGMYWRDVSALISGV
ncbi:MAG: helix-turn-helix transcriptional regulator [Clostridia bacterium]|nr:helix-turn-helix transcriptional regulator [Clostridia bacterium]